jgi:hypothetical protein
MQGRQWLVTFVWCGVAVRYLEGGTWRRRLALAACGVAVLTATC